MPFKKGESGHPTGRKKGAKNRTTEEVRQALLKILDDSLDQLKTDLKGMKGKERASLLISLAKHCTPPAVNPEKLSEENLLQIIQYLKEHEKNT